MKILVLGASGLVGSNLLETSRSLGYEAIGTCHAHALPHLVSLNLGDAASIRRLLRQFKPSLVFCCSGWSWVDGCESDPMRASRENTEYPAQAARDATEIHSRFIYFSTSYVFDGRAGPYVENAEPCPLSVYGHSKLEGEKAVLHATDGNALVVRTMGVYGTEPRKKNFVFQVREKLEAGQPMQVPKDQFGNVTYAPDLARMAIDLARQSQCGIWNLAGPDPSVRRSDFAIQIAQSYGLPVNLIEPIKTSLLHQPAQRPLHGGLYIKKAVQATSIMPQPWVKIP